MTRLRRLLNAYDGQLFWLTPDASGRILASYPDANTMNSVERLRSPADVAGRLVILASTCFVAQERSEQSFVVTWLKAQGIWSEVSPGERAFLEAQSASPAGEIAFSWNAECVYFLGWALGLTSALQPPTEQASTGPILDRLPAPGESIADFLRDSALRPTVEIRAAVEALHDAHASCRAAASNGVPERHSYNLEVCQERHRAGNWLICYEDADWDEVDTDT